MKRNPQNKQSLFSKLKVWCAVNNIPVIALPIVCFVLFAVTAVLIGGTIVGWDIAGFLTSSTGLLIITVSAFVILYLTLFFVTRRKR